MTDREKVIDGLHFTVGMMLFNPATGETKTPDELNKDNRYTYDACMGAIELLKKQETVVRCKDCAYLADNGICIVGIPHGHKETFYCVYGKGW